MRPCTACRWISDKLYGRRREMARQRIGRTASRGRRAGEACTGIPDPVSHGGYRYPHRSTQILSPCNVILSPTCIAGRTSPSREKISPPRSAAGAGPAPRPFLLGTTGQTGNRAFSVPPSGALPPPPAGEKIRKILCSHLAMVVVAACSESLQMKKDPRAQRTRGKTKIGVQLAVISPAGSSMLEYTSSFFICSSFYFPRAVRFLRE